MELDFQVLIIYFYMLNEKIVFNNKKIKDLLLKVIIPPSIIEINNVATIIALWSKLWKILFQFLYYFHLLKKNRLLYKYCM